MPDDPERRRITVIAERPETYQALQQLASSREGPDEVELELAGGDAGRAVTRAREALGARPIGFVAVSDRSAIAALEAGADEAVRLDGSDAAAFDRFVERTVVRAEMRGRQEALRVQLAQAEKLQALGTVVAGVAHEINNPAAAVLMSQELLVSSMKPLLEAVGSLDRLAAAGGGATPEQLAALSALARSGGPIGETMEMLEEIGTATKTISEVVRDLRIFSRTGEDEPAEVVDLHRLLDQVLRVVRGELQVAHVERDYDAGIPPVVVPRSRLAQVVTNLLINAGHAIRQVQRPVHRVRISTRSDAEGVVVSISDTGPGIPDEALERVFEPFYTTKTGGEATGLGLSVSREIMRRMGGELLVESVPGEGATFAVFIPPTKAEAPRRARPGRGPKEVAAAHRATVLIIDDDVRVLRSYARALRESYDVFLASDGGEAIDLLRSGSRADAIVCDLAMPEVDGRGFYDWLLAERPELAQRTIFATAGARDGDESFLATSGRLVLQKPISREALLGAVADCLQGRVVH